MNINDETLSAFLDQELPEEQMTQVRHAIAADPSVSERLAELASADTLVKQHARAIDTIPLPEAITAMLQADTPGKSAQNNVIPLPLWRRGHKWLSQHAALAAGVMLVIGFAAGTLTPGPTSSLDSGAIMAHLDSLPSGETVAVAPDTQVQNRFTFLDTQGRPCRQYQVRTAQEVSENVACRQDDGWELIATARASDIYQTGEYQPASGAALLDSVLDSIMPGGALSLEEEAALMSEW